MGSTSVQAIRLACASVTFPPSRLVHHLLHPFDCHLPGPRLASPNRRETCPHSLRVAGLQMRSHRQSSPRSMTFLRPSQRLEPPLPTTTRLFSSSFHPCEPPAIHAALFPLLSPCLHLEGQPPCLNLSQVSRLVGQASFCNLRQQRCLFFGCFSTAQDNHSHHLPASYARHLSTVSTYSTPLCLPFPFPIIYPSASAVHATNDCVAHPRS